MIDAQDLIKGLQESKISLQVPDSKEAHNDLKAKGVSSKIKEYSTLEVDTKDKSKIVKWLKSQGFSQNDILDVYPELLK